MTTTIEIGNLEHNTHNHDIKAGLSRHNNKYYQSELNISPSKLNMKPARYVADARAKGVPVNEGLKKSLKRQLTRLCNKSDGLLVNGQTNKWGGISFVLESYKMKCIVDFTEHSMFLLEIDCRPEDDSLVALLSTENLLLNAYRQRFWENPISLAADASYRITQEG